MRFAQIGSIFAGAACGGLLVGAVGSATHLPLVGACMGVALGAVVGAGLWSGKVSIMTVGGIFGAAFTSSAMCPPTGLAAPPGFLMGYGVTYVLRGIVRFIFSADNRRRGLTWLWLGWIASLVLWRNGAISGLVPAYAIIFLLAFEARDDATHSPDEPLSDVGPSEHR